MSGIGSSDVDQEPLDIRTRSLQAGDIPVAMDWMAADWGLLAARAASLRTLFATLLGEDRLRGGCIEELCPQSLRWRTAAIGVSTFVTEAAVDRYLASPSPFPSLQMLEAALKEGTSGVFLDTEAVARANATGGLNQLTIFYGQTVNDPSSPQWRRLLPASHKLHREVHGGYRMRRLLQDEWTLHEPVFVYAGYRVLQRFEEGTPCPLGLPPLPRPRSLVGLTASEAAAQLPGSTASFLFEYREPRLGLRSAERRLLQEAAAGRTDQEIADALCLSPNTLKVTWRNIYDRFAESAPFVLEAASPADSEGTRGPEKRRRVIAYVLDHLEELRPFAAD